MHIPNLEEIQALNQRRFVIASETKGVFQPYIPLQRAGEECPDIMGELTEEKRVEIVHQIQDDIANGTIKRSQVDQWMWEVFQEAIKEEGQ